MVKEQTSKMSYNSLWRCRSAERERGRICDEKKVSKRGGKGGEDLCVCERVNELVYSRR